MFEAIRSAISKLTSGNARVPDVQSPRSNHLADDPWYIDYTKEHAAKGDENAQAWLDTFHPKAPDKTANAKPTKATSATKQHRAKSPGMGM